MNCGDELYRRKSLVKRHLGKFVSAPLTHPGAGPGTDLGNAPCKRSEDARTLRQRPGPGKAGPFLPFLLSCPPDSTPGVNTRPRGGAGTSPEPFVRPHDGSRPV